MIKKVTSVAVVALIAAAPTFSFAQGVAASLSASFGSNEDAVAVLDNAPTATVVAPRSVSVAGAAGDYAVASSVATATSSGAAAGATSDADLPPIASVVDNSGVYETSVTFGPTDFDAAISTAIADLCANGFVAGLDDLTVDVDPSVTSGFGSGISQATADLLIAAVADGTVTVSCAS